MPMTIINLASLIIILKAGSWSKRECYEFDPRDPGPLVLAEPSLDEGEPSRWTDSVTYYPGKMREFHLFVDFSAD